MFKINTVLNGLVFNLIKSTDGTPIISGVVTTYIVKDNGTQASSTNSAVHKGNGQWSINLTAPEMNAEVVGLLFTHPSAISVSLTIKTDNPVSELIPPDNNSIATILADTDELQTNQSNWLTAAGYAPAVTVDAIKTKVDTLVNTDLSLVAKSSEIALLNDFDPSNDVVANVTNITNSVAVDVNSIALAVESILLDEFSTVNANISSSDITAIVNAIKSSTDKMVFTKSGELDVNVKSQNSATVYGLGISTDRWRGTA